MPMYVHMTYLYLTSARSKNLNCSKLFSSTAGVVKNIRNRTNPIEKHHTITQTHNSMYHCYTKVKHNPSQPP